MFYFLFPTTPPRPDELDKLVCLIGEVKVSLVKLAKATTQPPTPQENSEEVYNDWQTL